MDPPICRADSLAVPERLVGKYAVLNPLGIKTFWFSEAAAHAPGGLEMLITPSDELRWS